MRTALIALACLYAAPSLAAEAVTERTGPCQSFEDPARRLDCYDQAAAGARREAETFTDQVFRLCYSPGQSSCWVRPATPFCDINMADCQSSKTSIPVRVVRQVGGQFLVQTPKGVGYVPVDRIVLDGSK